MLGQLVAEEGDHALFAEGPVVAEGAFGLAQHLGEDLVLEVGVGVGVGEDVDYVLRDQGGADDAGDFGFMVVEVGGPGVCGNHIGDGMGVEPRVGPICWGGGSGAIRVLVKAYD